MRKEQRIGRRFGPDRKIKVIAYAGYDKHRHALVEIHCEACDRNSTMRWSDLVRKKACSASGKVRKANGSCGCQSRVAYRRILDDGISKIPKAECVLIWAESQGEKSASEISRKHGLNKYMGRRVVSLMEKRLSEFQAENMTWFRECQRWKTFLEEQWEYQKEEDAGYWDRVRRDQPALHGSRKLDRPSYIPWRRRRYGCFSRFETHKKNDHGLSCWDLIANAKKILRDWDYFDCEHAAFIKEICRRRGYFVYDFLEMARWIDSTDRKTQSRRNEASKLAIRRRQNEKVSSAKNGKPEGDPYQSPHAIFDRYPVYQRA